MPKCANCGTYERWTKAKWFSITVRNPTPTWDEVEIARFRGATPSIRRVFCPKIECINALRKLWYVVCSNEGLDHPPPTLWDKFSNNKNTAAQFALDFDKNIGENILFTYLGIIPKWEKVEGTQKRLNLENTQHD
jgi:hypothetical protein